MTDTPPEGVWTVTAEFVVMHPTPPRSWQPCCPECLPLLLRRAHRESKRPAVIPAQGEQCKVRDPHPAPGTGVPPAGYSCPRPLTGACITAGCDHD